MEDLLLDRDELDYIESNPIFSLWLFGNVDENSLSEEEKRIIIARQMYYDLVVSDDVFIHILNRFNCHDIDMFLNDKKIIVMASHYMGIRSDYLRVKAHLMKKRQLKEKNKKLEL